MKIQLSVMQNIYCWSVWIKIYFVWQVSQHVVEVFRTSSFVLSYWSFSETKHAHRWMNLTSVYRIYIFCESWSSHSPVDKNFVLQRHKAASRDLKFGLLDPWRIWHHVPSKCRELIGRGRSVLSQAKIIFIFTSFRHRTSGTHQSIL